MKNEINWHSIKKEGFPKEEGEYLITTKFYNELVRFTNDLNKIDDYDFPKNEYLNKKGFYIYDSEFGYCDIDTDSIIAWVKVEPYNGE